MQEEKMKKEKEKLENSNSGKDCTTLPAKDEVHNSLMYLTGSTSLISMVDSKLASPQNHGDLSSEVKHRIKGNSLNGSAPLLYFIDGNEFKENIRDMSKSLSNL